MSLKTKALMRRVYEARLPAGAADRGEHGYGARAWTAVFPAFSDVLVAMSVFREAEIRYLAGGRQLGRIATVGADGTPHVVPVAWIYNAVRERSTSGATNSSGRRSSATWPGRGGPRS